MTELKFTKRDAETSPEFLRSQGLVPAICYGAGFENNLVAVNDIDFRKVYRDAGTSGLITLTGDITGEQCLVQDMQVHVVTGDLLHIDFKMVTQGEVTEVTVPVVLIGESPAVSDKVGLLNISHDEIIIETVPSKIPDSIEIDIAQLKELGDSVKVSDLNLGSEITIMLEPDATVVSIIAVKEESSDQEVDSTMEPELVDQKGKAEELAE